MARQEARKEAMELKKRLKNMSVNQIEQLFLNIEREAEGRMIEAFRAETNKQLKVGPKRFAKLLYGVSKRLERR